MESNAWTSFEINWNLDFEKNSARLWIYADGEEEIKHTISRQTVMQLADMFSRAAFLMDENQKPDVRDQIPQKGD